MHTESKNDRIFSVGIFTVRKLAITIEADKMSRKSMKKDLHKGKHHHPK